MTHFRQRTNSILFLGAILLLAMLCDDGKAQGRWIYKTGNDLVEDMRGYESEGRSETQRLQAISFLSYIKGVLDEVEAEPHRGVSGGQAAAIVAKYLKENPERWDKRGAVLVIEAMSEAAKKRDSRP